ncbi:transcriptional regulator NrdR [Patescibacteria group bacterium]|nr:transcriptional regulator NrdR [Patescibacteria group bacterium]MBU1890194.1 transcriptional regulator NrdR [Patescibacteria group bacterium]
MHCPLCHEETKVVDSRSVNSEMTVRRRRECLKCNFRFTTHEQIELLDIQVIKKDGGREAYKRIKLEAGVRKALEKRPFGEEDIQKLIMSIEVEIQKVGGQQIASQKIGHIVINKLKDFDSVAYLRFASVYKSFDDLKTFNLEINKLEDSN